MGALFRLCVLNYRKAKRHARRKENRRLRVERKTRHHRDELHSCRAQISKIEGLSPLFKLHLKLQPSYFALLPLVQGMTASDQLMKRRALNNSNSQKYD